MGTVQSVFNLAGRQTEGFLESLFILMGIELKVPDHSTLCRRLSYLSVELPVIPKDEAIHVVVDSTGVKVYGKGEWKVRTHGVGKRRTWQKLHLGVDQGSGEILAAVVTTNDVADCEVLPDLLEQIDSNIEQVKLCFWSKSSRFSLNIVIWLFGPGSPATTSTISLPLGRIII